MFGRIGRTTQLPESSMTNSQRLSVVRGLLESWWRERQPDAAEELSESILIRDGFYCGRRFTCGSLSAVWFAEEDQIKLFDQEGQLVDSLAIEEFQQSVQRRAA